MTEDRAEAHVEETAWTRLILTKIWTMDLKSKTHKSCDPQMLDLISESPLELDIETMFLEDTAIPTMMNYY